MKQFAITGADPGFQVRGGGGGAHLKKLRRAGGGAKIVGVFRVKNLTPKNHIFSNFRGARGRARRVRHSPGIAPAYKHRLPCINDNLRKQPNNKTKLYSRTSIYVLALL